MVAVLLRFILWRCADFHRAAVHRAAADTPLKLKDGYAVRAILPRPERRGLSRTRSLSRVIGDGVVGVKGAGRGRGGPK